MAKQELSISKKRGRPPTGLGTPVLVRLQQGDLENLDWYIEETHKRTVDYGNEDAKPMTRPQAIRELLLPVLDRIAERKNKQVRKRSKGSN